MAETVISLGIEAQFDIHIIDGIDWRWYTDPETGEKEWRGDGYRLVGDEGIIAHWAHNAAANGVIDASQLDGWADIPRGAITFAVTLVEV